MERVTRNGDRRRMRAGAHPSEASCADLSVLRTAVRRLADIGLKVYDVWASRAEPEALEVAEDTVKPMLEQLLRDGGYPEVSDGSAPR